MISNNLISPEVSEVLICELNSGMAVMLQSPIN
jgi:hypothetical protein